MSGHDSPARYARAEPKYFGLPPLVLVSSVGLLALVAAVLLLVAGRVVIGSVVLAGGVLALLIVAQEVRRRRTSPFEAAVAARVDRLLDASRFGLASLTTWSRAGRRLARLRLEAAALLRERARLSAYAHDAAAARRIAEIDARLAVCEAEAHGAVGEAHSRVEEERLSVSETQIIKPGIKPK